MTNKRIPKAPIHKLSTETYGTAYGGWLRLLFWKQASSARISTEYYLLNGCRRARPHGAHKAALQRLAEITLSLPMPQEGCKESVRSTQGPGAAREGLHCSNVLRFSVTTSHLSRWLTSFPQNFLITNPQQDSMPTPSFVLQQQFLQISVMRWVIPSRPPAGLQD